MASWADARGEAGGWAASPAAGPPPGPGPWGQALRRLLHHRPAVAGLIYIAIVGVLALAAPVVTWHDPTALHADHSQEGPSLAFPLGTDQLGRDQFSRLVYGARISLPVGLGATATALAVGLAVGAAAALGGRRVDALLMRATDVAFAFPDLLLVILLVSVFGASFSLVVLAIGLVTWPTIARLVRGQMLALQEEEFVVAARALGAARWQIALRHLLPNALGPLIVTAAFAVPAAIFAEAALAFLRLGVSSESWGALVIDGKPYWTAAPHLLAYPCLAVALTMMSFTFIGDGLRDALDPRTPVGPAKLPAAVEPPDERRPPSPAAKAA